MKKQKSGITLIALVITIIVLLMLAGITINMLTGEENILKNAQLAAEEQKIIQGKERVEIILEEITIDKIIEHTTIEEILDKIKGKEGISEVIQNEKDPKKITITIDEGYMYEVIIDDERKTQIEYIGKSTGPIIRKIEVTEKNSSSISVNVSTINAEGEIYIYWYKKQEEQNYIKAKEAKDTIYTYEGLEANVIYDIKVEIKGKHIEKTISVITGEIETGTITFEKEVWNNGTASVGINTTTNYEIHIYKGKIDDDKTEKEIKNEIWEKVSEDGLITGLIHNDKIYARLYDGTNYGTDWATVEITDTEKPEIEISTNELTSNSVVLTVRASDAKMGLATEGTYKYYLGEELKETSENNTYQYTDLTVNTPYTLKVIVKDKAGNTNEASTEIELKLQVNYGTQIETNYENLYVSTNPTTPISKVSTNENYYNGNYKYPIALATNMEYEKLTLGQTTNNDGEFQYVYSGVNTINLTQETNLNRWMYVWVRFSGWSYSLTLSNYYLVFADGNTYTLQEAVEEGYIEPLVVLSSSSHSTSYLLSNTLKLLDNSASAPGNFSDLMNLFKVKDKSALKAVKIQSNKNFDTRSDGIAVYEYIEGIEFSTEPFE